MHNFLVIDHVENPHTWCHPSCSDHIALLKAFEAWKDAKCNGKERSFCWENFLSPVTLQMMEDMRNQFRDLLSDIGFVNKTRGAKVCFKLLIYNKVMKSFKKNNKSLIACYFFIYDAPPVCMYV